MKMRFKEWVLQFKDDDTIHGDFVRDYIRTNYKFTLTTPACTEAKQAYIELREMWKQLT